jgi:hypothetical protein
VCDSNVALAILAGRASTSLIGCRLRWKRVRFAMKGRHGTGLPYEPQLLRQRVAPFDEADDQTSGFRRLQVRPVLDPLCLVSEIGIFHRFPKPR